MRIIAVDPGFERLGIAVLEKNPAKETLLFSNCLKTSSKTPSEERLFHVGQEIKTIIKKYAPEALAIEKLFFGINKKTAIRVAEARGVVVYEASSAKIPVYEYTPLQVKIAVTGYGHAPKKQVETMVARLIVMDKKKRTDDEIDAVAIGLTHFANMKMRNILKIQ